MGRLLVYTVTNTGSEGDSPPIKEKKSEICKQICKQKWKMVSAHDTISQSVIIQSRLIIYRIISNIFVIEVKVLATFRRIKSDSSR